MNSRAEVMGSPGLVIVDLEGPPRLYSEEEEEVEVEDVEEALLDARVRE